MVNRTISYSFIVLNSLFLLSACRGSSPKEETDQAVISPYEQSILEQRKSKDLNLIKEGSIEEELLKDFEGLKYYAPDEKYVVRAGFKKLPPLPIEFKTNTDRTPLYYTFAVLDFKWGDSTCSLIAYSNKQDASDGLFIPFRELHHPEVYGGGRYIEMPYLGETDSIRLDFNTAFNPYCHYNHKYSCPVVPPNNFLNVKIEAGEKKLHE